MVKIEAMFEVDRAHLVRQTLGNQELQREVLTLFLGQADRVLGELEGESLSVEAQREAAHSLVGSARGVGAFAVADAAAAIEREKVRAPSTGLTELRHALAKARGEIIAILAE